MLKEATIPFCLFDESYFRWITLVLFSMWYRMYKGINCVSIEKRLEAAKLLF